MSREFFKKVKWGISTVSFFGVALLCYQIVALSQIHQRNQHDYSEINDIKYGLFSVNQWKQKLADIINEEITRLSISETDKNQIKPLLEEQLSSLIDSVRANIDKANKKTFKGRVKQAFIDTFVDIKEIKKGIPKYADDMIKIMERPKTRRELNGIILEKVGEYFENTFEEQDLSRLNEVVMKLGVANIEAARVELDRKIQIDSEEIFLKTWLMIGLASLVFIMAAFSKSHLPNADYTLMVLTLFALLIAGVTSPMINLEAKITEMSFVLFDHPVKFINQILYFQTKSVLDVFWIMITHPQIQMNLVGILMVVFSVVFPVLKLLSSLFYFYRVRDLQNSKIVQFFVLKSGKWSMTDVLIIAIFMAYIGFNGIIASQFDEMRSADREIVLLTTNGTSLQPGFYLFLAYATLALFLSELLTKQGPWTESSISIDGIK